MEALIGYLEKREEKGYVVLFGSFQWEEEERKEEKWEDKISHFLFIFFPGLVW